MVVFVTRRTGLLTALQRSVRLVGVGSELEGAVGLLDCLNGLSNVRIDRDCS